VDFVVSFLFIRPHMREKWDANTSTALNRIVDELLREENLDSEHESRKDLLSRLCHHLFDIHNWKQEPDWFCANLFPGPLQHPDGNGDLAFAVLQANILLGRHTTLAAPGVLDLPSLAARGRGMLGTFASACAKSGNVHLVQ
jgi:hypothetical protein